MRLEKTIRRSRTVCMSVDDRYFWPWIVTVNSAILNCVESYPKFILANINGMLSIENQRIAKEFAVVYGFKLEIMELKLDRNLVFQHHFNVTIYSRIILMDILDEDFLWLDSDLLMLPGWDSIFDEPGDLNVEGIVLWGVLDSEYHRTKLSNENNQALVISGGRYLNTGVLLMSPSNWRKIPNRDDWLSLSQNSSNYGINSNDQDILNLLCANRIAVIPKKYNYIVGDETTIRDKILVYHFAGPPKPWRLNKIEKEFFLGSHGYNYFKKENWISYFSDTFLFYPQYWKVEDEIISNLTSKNVLLAQSVGKIKDSQVNQRTDFFLQFKHFCSSLLNRKWK